MTAAARSQRLSVSYGGVHALTTSTSRCAEGQLVGLIGPNGAGKTTFIDAIRASSRTHGHGRCSRRATSLAWPGRTPARRGLARTWQSTELFDDLTVRENLAVAA